MPYDIWEKEGFLQTTEGNVVHYGYIENFIQELGLKYNIREIAFDKLARKLVEKAIVYDDRIVVEFKSGLEIEVNL